MNECSLKEVFLIELTLSSIYELNFVLRFDLTVPWKWRHFNYYKIGTLEFLVIFLFACILKNTSDQVSVSQRNSHPNVFCLYLFLYTKWDFCCWYAVKWHLHLNPTYLSVITKLLLCSKHCWNGQNLKLHFKFQQRSQICVFLENVYKMQHKMSRILFDRWCSYKKKLELNLMMVQWKVAINQYRTHS